MEGRKRQQAASFAIAEREERQRAVLPLSMKLRD